MKKFMLFYSVFFLSLSGFSQNIPYPVVPDWESSPEGHVATGLGLADINGDGWKDIIVANGNDIQRQHLVVYYNLGDGSFNPVPDWESQDIDYHGHLAVGDLNADGWPDVAVSVYIGPEGFSSPGKLKVYFNNQGILEDEPSFVSYDYYTFSCAMGDADGDGDLDIATTGGEPYQSLDDYGKIFYNNNGTFSNLPQWTSSFKFGSLDVDFGDLDQNGKLDIAFASEASPNYLYTANDLGEISNVPAWQSAENTNFMNSLDMGFIGQDQTMGIVFTGNNQLGGDGKVKLYSFSDEIPSESDAVWSSTVSGYWSGVLLHDVDLDGINDLIYGGWWLPVNIHLGNSDYFDTLPSYTSLTSSVVEAIQVADLNKDGMQDTFESFLVDEQDNSLFWLKHPVEFINSVVVTGFGIGPEYYCYVPGKNWLSVDKEIVANGDTVYISYQYSNKGDIVISNWDSSKGNYIFYNDATLTFVSDDRKQEFDFRVYPNPAHNDVFISFRQMQKSNVTLSFCDLNGRLVRRIDYRDMQEGKHSAAINVNGLPEGLYVIKLMQGHFTKSKKIIIQ